MEQDQSKKSDKPGQPEQPAAADNAASAKEQARAKLAGELAKLPQQDSLKTTLYDLAQNSLERRAPLTGEKHDQNSVYHELNRIMGINGYPQAHLDKSTGQSTSGNQGKISDHDLPAAWNQVKHNQIFKLYDGGDADRRKRIMEDIVKETSTVPVDKDEGYFQVLKRMRPDARDEDLTKEAHRIKHINRDREVLKVGERLATATEEERRAELERRLKALTEPKPAPDKTQTAPDQVKPAPDKTQTAPDQVKPAPDKTQTVPDQVKPAPDKTQTVPDQVKPAPDKTQTAPDQLKPAPDNQPDPGEARKQQEALRSSMEATYALLAKQMNLAEKKLGQAQDQGIIGKTFDAAKTHLGASGEGQPWYNPGRIWSGILDSDLSSKAVQEKLAGQKRDLDELKKAVDDGDETRFKTIYKGLTGKDFTGPQPGQAIQAATLKSGETVKAFDESQRAGVDTITDVGTGIAAAMSLRYGAKELPTLARAGLVAPIIGATTKATLMQVDGHYANLPRDAAMGGILGLTVPLGEMAGSAVSRAAGKKLGMTVTGDILSSRIETMGTGFGTRLLSASLKSGTSGAVFGGVQAPASEVSRDIEQGKEIHAGDLALLSLKGAAMGFVGGTVLGAAADRLSDGFKSWKPQSFNHAKPTIGGVEVADSAVGLDEAAKILKIKPEALARKAAADPYAAVHDAVKLYEKTGLNIGPQAGKTLPPEFSQALKTVQDVDLLTSNEAVRLAKKVEIVKSTDAYFKTNPQTIDEPLQRLAGDQRYQDLMKLKSDTEGAASAAKFDEAFRNQFSKDLKTASAVERIKDGTLNDAQAAAKASPATEAAYKQKVEEFFKDMTDPVQKERLVNLVEDIYAKFNPELISKQDLSAMLDRVPQHNRALAVALLQESAQLSSDSTLKGSMQALRGEIETATGSSAPGNVVTLRPDSSGNLLAYLYRKSNSIGMSINNIDGILENGHVPNSVVLFDDLASTPLTLGQQRLLSQIPHVYAVDLGAFEKGINVIDLSRGANAVENKLTALLTQAEQVQAANPGLLPTGVARQVLSGAVDDAARAIGPNVQVIRPGSSIRVPHAPSAAELAAMSDVEAVHAQINVPKASREEIASFLTGYAGPERELAAQMLADGAVHNSFPVMVSKAVDLHKKLQDALTANGMSMRDLVLVSDKDPGGSTHLVSYLFGKVNGLSSENYISARGLDKMVQSGAAGNRAVAYFDDTIYSGAQTTSMLNYNVSSLMPFKRVVIASLGAYEKGVQSIRGTHLSSLGKVDVASAAMHQPFYSSQNPFFNALDASKQYTVKNIGGAEGFGNVQGSIIWSYMYPDNNLTFFGSKFSGSVLRLPGP